MCRYLYKATLLRFTLTLNIQYLRLSWSYTWKYFIHLSAMSIRCSYNRKVALNTGSLIQFTIYFTLSLSSCEHWCSPTSHSFSTSISSYWVSAVMAFRSESFPTENGSSSYTCNIRSMYILASRSKWQVFSLNSSVMIYGSSFFLSYLFENDFLRMLWLSGMALSPTVNRWFCLFNISACFVITSCVLMSCVLQYSWIFWSHIT